MIKTTDLPSHSDAETLHDIPELEASNTLIRMGGNIKLLRNLICRFSETQADTVVRIKEALAFDNIETARLKVHTLKSLAGAIGATSLENHAQILENMCKNNIVEGRDEIVHNLEIDLTNLLARIYTAYDTRGEATGRV